LEDKVVTISRATGRLTFPANLMLVEAINPCPSGYYGDLVKECTCSPMMISRYRPASLRGFRSVTSASRCRFTSETRAWQPGSAMYRRGQSRAETVDPEETGELEG
jgi:hypothetical protein